MMKLIVNTLRCLVELIVESIEETQAFNVGDTVVIQSAHKEDDAILAGQRLGHYNIILRGVFDIPLQVLSVQKPLKRDYDPKGSDVSLRLRFPKYGGLFVTVHDDGTIGAERTQTLKVV
jgi:hypothetical protein